MVLRDLFLVAWWSFRRFAHGFAWLLASGLGSGLSPAAPGTVGSLVAVAAYYFSPLETDHLWHLASYSYDFWPLLADGSLGFYVLIVAGFLVGVWAAGLVSSRSDPDPGYIVWDEFVGMWVTCLFLPKSLLLLTIAFLAFRFFDVVKPFPIRRLERLPGGLGIMADDLLAGIYGAVVCNFLLFVWLSWSN